MDGIIKYIRRTVLSLATCLFFLAGFCPVVWASDSQPVSEFAEKCSYTVLTDGTVEITGYAGPESEIVIPSQLDGYQVTRIGERAFSGLRLLESVVIPDDVTEIGSSAFSSCGSLTDIVIPDSVTVIGEGAFVNCISLENIELPDGITEIAANTFEMCTGLTNIKLPASLTAIETEAFMQCNHLTAIDLPDGLVTVGSSAFAECSRLQSIELPDSVTEIGSSAFSACSSLTDISLPASLVTVGNYAFSGCEKLSDVEYYGTEEQWEMIDIGKDDALSEASIHYNSARSGIEEGTDGEESSPGQTEPGNISSSSLADTGNAAVRETDNTVNDAGYHNSLLIWVFVTVVLLLVLIVAVIAILVLRQRRKWERRF